MADGLRRFEEALQAMAGQAGSGRSPSGTRRSASGATGGHMDYRTARGEGVPMGSGAMES